MSLERYSGQIRQAELESASFSRLNIDECMKMIRVWLIFTRQSRTLLRWLRVGLFNVKNISHLVIPCISRPIPSLLPLQSFTRTRDVNTSHRVTVAMPWSAALISYPRSSASCPMVLFLAQTYTYKITQRPCGMSTSLECIGNSQCS
jgi:hypothetical protein